MVIQGCADGLQGTLVIRGIGRQDVRITDTGRIYDTYSDMTSPARRSWQSFPAGDIVFAHRQIEAPSDCNQTCTGSGFGN